MSLGLNRLHALFEHLHDKVLLDPTLDEWCLEKFTEFDIFRAFLMDPHPLQVLDEYNTLERTAREVRPIVSAFNLKKMDIFMARQLLEELKPIKIVNAYWYKRARGNFEEWEKPSQENYPRTNQHGYLDHVAEYLEQVKAKAEYDVSIRPLKLLMLQIQRLLELVSGRLSETPEQRKEDPDLKILIEGITNLAYDIEHAIDLYIVREIPLWYSLFWLQDIQKELKYGIGQLNAEYGDMNSIISQIIDYQPNLKIVGILNNTEISRKVDDIFNLVAYRFQIWTWCVASSYKEKKKEVFLQLLCNASAHDPKIRDQMRTIASSDDPDIDIGVRDQISQTRSRSGVQYKAYRSDLSEKQFKSVLNGLVTGDNNTCFIMLEDVNDIEDLDDIMKVLPDNYYKNGKILITTHSRELVAYCHSGCRKDLFIAKKYEDQTTTSQQRTMPTMEGDVVGFKTETQRMLERLTRESKQLHIISIAGMPGQGKTTFAKKLYNHFSIVSYFHKRAWCCVSQVYDKNALLLELLSQVVELTDTIRHTNDHELTEMLWKTLKGQRFLVVLDDVWSGGAWDDLKRCFPNDKNGSRIIFTTRLLDLASQVQLSSVLQTLGQLSDDESWTLLQHKLFQKDKESCPPQLLEVGMEIAKHCKGLPLSVVLTAGLLKKMEKKEDVWKEIAETFSSRILGDADAENKGVIHLSYKHLPDFLKPCFLYFGAFLEDKEVPVKILLRLWIAEGFIKHSDSKMLEEVADDYLEDLIGRSLITVAREKSNGGVKSCRVHDLLREFALTKAREENFLHQIQRYDEQLDSWSKTFRFNTHRLCIYSKSNHFFNLRVGPLGPYVRSLLFFGASVMSPSYSYDISFIFHNFKLLRILKFEDINIGNSFEGIDVLHHLRYLAVQGTMVSVPSWISNLSNLETFCFKSLEDKVVEVPDSIWNLTSLRNLHINECASFDMERVRRKNSIIHDNLQTLSTPSLAYGDHMEKILRKLLGIRKLKCIFLDSLDNARNFNQFPVLEFLNKLESLKILYNGKRERQYTSHFNFPMALKKLTLTNFQLPWSDITQLARINNLEVLKLVGNAFEGERWEMEDKVVFQNLKFLKMDTLNVVEWIANDDQFPRLERLLLHKCEELKEIPSSIGDITTLLMIEVKWCSASAATSARDIQEEQLQFGNERLEINVWDTEPSG